MRAEVPCPDDGWVRTLKGQVACFTGKVLIDGVWTERKDCVKRVEALGASWKPDYSRRVSLVVFGDLASAVVTDPERHYSQKLDLAQADRERGLHVHVVDARGFSDLLDGEPAICRQLKAKAARVLPVHQQGDGVLGGPLVARAVGSHQSTALSLDLSGLDAGTAAHEATVRALVAHLAAKGQEARRPAKGAPLFDIGWALATATFIAEIKSLTGTSEDQQIRLGFGQLLDYAHQLRASGAVVTPVLVLERRPDSDRWAGLAESESVILTWAPDFPGF